MWLLLAKLRFNGNPLVKENRINEPQMVTLYFVNC